MQKTIIAVRATTHLSTNNLGINIVDKEERGYTLLFLFGGI